MQAEGGVGEPRSRRREENDSGGSGSSSGLSSPLHYRNDNDSNNNSGGMLPPLRPIHYHTILFLLITTLFQIISSLQNKAGPFDYFAAIFIPSFASLGFLPGNYGAGRGYGMGYDNSADDDSDEGELTCPSGEWIDSVFAMHHPRSALFVTKDVEGNGALYSVEHDPRNKIVNPTYFPHCALRRWVKKGGVGKNCPVGTEYAAVFLPPRASASKSLGKGKGIPKMIHISSPTNCLPTTTITTLRQLAGSGEHTFYIHSPEVMDALIYEREWDAFPEAKEGVMCGVKKLEMASLAALKELKVGGTGEGNNSTTSSTPADMAAEEIGLGVKRDIWRLLVLWEYGGVTLGMDALTAILTKDGPANTGSSTNNATTATQITITQKGIQTMQTLLNQWSTETSNALLYFINNEAKQRLPYNQRVVLTDIMGAAPRHPLVYYTAKEALKTAVWDAEKSITDTGRTSKIHSITQALTRMQRNWWTHVKTGEVMQISSGDDTHSIHFLDGDVILPPSLSSPRSTPWMTIFSAFNSAAAAAGNGSGPTEDDINQMMRHFAAEQNYIPRGMFSCMEYRLNMYMGKTTKVKEEQKASG